MPAQLQKLINGSDMASQLAIDPQTGKLMKDKDGEDMTFLPKTKCEFEMGEKLSKIKAIRGLTPKKDVKIQLGTNFSAVSTAIIDALVTCVEVLSRCAIQGHGPANCCN